jgi:hypothetical protein
VFPYLVRQGTWWLAQVGRYGWARSLGGAVSGKALQPPSQQCEELILISVASFFSGIWQVSLWRGAPFTSSRPQSIPRQHVKELRTCLSKRERCLCGFVPTPHITAAPTRSCRVFSTFGIAMKPSLFLPAFAILSTAVAQFDSQQCGPQSGNQKCTGSKCCSQ